MKQIKILRPFGMIALCAVLMAACGSWTDQETVGIDTTRPDEKDPALTERYRAALRAYKQSEHYRVYALFDNAPRKPASEKDFMRCLPDSLDFVSLTNADNLSAFDIEDLPALKEKGTRVLYRIDYAARAGDFADMAALETYLDKAVATATTHKLDGFAFTGIPRPGSEQAASLLVSKLSGEGRTLAFEGDPAFVTPADRAAVDLFVLDTYGVEFAVEAKLKVLAATGHLGIPASKIMLATGVGAVLIDEENKEREAIPVMTERVVSYGPLAGLALSGIEADYYEVNGNYPVVRGAIQALNPSK